jgi:hypothetical protein
MNKKSIYRFLAFFFIVVPSFAQQYKQATIDLSPVVIENGNYYFNGQRVSFDAMMIPLISVQDDEINRKLKVMNTTKNVFKIAVGIHQFTSLSKVSVQTNREYISIKQGFDLGNYWCHYGASPSASPPQ